MDRIEEILRDFLNDCCVVCEKDGVEKLIEERVEQINQLYEPQPQECEYCDGLGEIDLRDNSPRTVDYKTCEVCKGTGKPQPDQSSRLLTDEEIKTIYNCWSITNLQSDILCQRVAKAQLAKDEARIEALIEACRKSVELLGINLEYNRGEVTTILKEALKANKENDKEDSNG